MVQHGATMVPRWCHDGATMVPRWCHDGATMVPRWCHDGAIWHECKWRHGPTPAPLPVNGLRPGPPSETLKDDSPRSRVTFASRRECPHRASTMPSTTCTKCRRANPADAAFCYFDGHLLNGHGATGPVAIGRQPFAHPFVFTSGRQCRNYDELALACHEDWDEALDLLRQGYLERFLGGLGRADLARAARDAARCPDPDLGLDDLLDKLPTDVLQPPHLHAGAAEINLGTLAVGEDRRFELRLENQRHAPALRLGHLRRLRWLAVGEGPAPGRRLFQFGGGGDHPRPRRRPAPARGQQAAGGAAGRRVQRRRRSPSLVRAEVPIRPFPDGPLKGAVTPRQVAEKAKAAPQGRRPPFSRTAPSPAGTRTTAGSTRCRGRRPRASAPCSSSSRCLA